MLSLQETAHLRINFTTLTRWDKNNPTKFTIISVVLFNFMVQEPRGIMECTRDKSLFSNCFMYLTIFVSDWNLKIHQQFSLYLECTCLPCCFMIKMNFWQSFITTHRTFWLQFWWRFFRYKIQLIRLDLAKLRIKLILYIILNLNLA